MLSNKRIAVTITDFVDFFCLAAIHRLDLKYLS